jgi:ribose/xylose/arabinose/galactoside ABC-type transport system permease subunit
MSAADGRTVGRAGLHVLTGQIPLLALIVLIAVSALVSDRFLSLQNISNVLIQTSIMAIVVIGMTLVIVGGGFDLSVGSVVALSGCIAAYIVRDVDISLGIVAGTLVGTAVGVVNGLIVTKLRVNPFIATLGMMVLVRGVVLLVTDGRPIYDLPPGFIAIGGGSLFGIHYLIWILAVLFVIFHWILHRTPYGVRVFASGGNREAAFLSGINVDRVTTSTYVWCGTLAGIAGVLLAARLESGNPTTGEFYELTAIAAVVLGGASLYGGEGKLYKSMVGVLIMIVLGNSLNIMGVPSYWQRVAIGVVIIAAAAADRFRRRG